MDLTLRQPFLQGYGFKLNSRGIRIAEVNTTASREVFRSRLLDLVASVLNLYWGVVSASDELKGRQRALDFTQKFHEDTQKEIAAGAIPRVELPRAEAELAKRRQDVVIARQNLGQQAIALKAVLVRTEDPALEAAEIIPLDQIQVPDADNLPPLRQLVATAMAKRPDVLVTKYRDQTAEMALSGTTNPLLPSLSGSVQTYNRGVAGTPQNTGGGSPNPYFTGGYGSALGQIFRRNFPNNIAGLSFSASLANRVAQGDYGIDQLQFVQSQLSGQRDVNSIIVEADQKKFSSGIATFNEIIVDQRALAAAQISEVTAMGSYARARVSLDQTLGETLEQNHISLDEGLNGRVARESQLPAIAQTPPANP